jgi:hypothetical protein
MTPGYGDDYYSQLEGQFIDLSGVPAGRYDLVHVANEDCTLHESSHGNNAAAVKLDVSWSGGVPSVVQLPGTVSGARYAPCGAAQIPPGGSPGGSSPTAPGSGAAPGPSTAAGAPSARITRAPGRVSPAGWMAFLVKCASPARRACRGTLSVRRTARIAGRPVRQLVAQRRFSLRPGARAYVRARLSVAARRLLARRGSLTVTAGVRLDRLPNGSRPATLARGVVLRAPGRRGGRSSARVATSEEIRSSFLCFL